MGAPALEKIFLVPGVEVPALKVGVEGPVLKSHAALFAEVVDPDHLANVRTGSACGFGTGTAFQRAEWESVSKSWWHAGQTRGEGRLSTLSTLAQLSRETGRESRGGNQQGRKRWQGSAPCESHNDSFPDQIVALLNPPSAPPVSLRAEETPARRLSKPGRVCTRIRFVPGRPLISQQSYGGLSLAG